MFDDMMAAIETRPKNFGPMRNASAHAKIKGPCGDTVEVWLDIGSNKIQQASFMTDGCAHSTHCCSEAVKLTEGMRLEEAAELTQAQVLEAAEAIPPDHQHCALLAANTIRKAIAEFQAKPVRQSFWHRLRRSFRP
jgi:nitrogen fixation NifU-like protein